LGRKANCATAQNRACMRVEREVEVCLIGLGGTGGMAAAVLAVSGKSVVALEAGPSWTGHEHAMDEISSSNGRNVWGAAKFNHDAQLRGPGAVLRPDRAPRGRVRPGRQRALGDAARGQPV